MYRIIFDPQSATWQVQLQTLVFLWRTINTVETFDNYDEARAYVDRVGLNRVYRDYQDSYASQLWNDRNQDFRPARVAVPPPRTP